MARVPNDRNIIEAKPDVLLRPELQHSATDLTPEVAAEFMMGYLPEDTAYFIREAATHTHAPVWQMLLGYVMRCSDGMLLYSPFLLSSWETGMRPSAQRQCSKCGLAFQSKFPDAKYCCERCFFDKLDAFGHAGNCPTRER